MKATTAKPPKSSMRVKKRTEWITVVASTRNVRRTQTGTLPRADLPLYKSLHGSQTAAIPREFAISVLIPVTEMVNRTPLVLAFSTG